MLSERSAGFAAIIGTCIVWGLSPIYYHAIEGTPALTILAHRTIWSLVIFALLLGPQGRLGQLTSALIGPEWSRIVLAALMISANWFIFIWSVLSGHAVEASLGYYILPLVSVGLGVRTHELDVTIYNLLVERGHDVRTANRERPACGPRIHDVTPGAAGSKRKDTSCVD